MAINLAINIAVLCMLAISYSTVAVKPGGNKNTRISPADSANSCLKSTLIPLNSHYLAIPCSSRKDEEEDEYLEGKIYTKWSLPPTVKAEDIAFSKQGTAIMKVVNGRINGQATCDLTYGKHSKTYKHHIIAYDMPKYRFISSLAFKSTFDCTLNDEHVQAKIELVKDVACPTHYKLCERTVEGYCKDDKHLVIDVYGRKIPVQTEGKCGISCGSTRAMAKATSNMDYLLHEFTQAHLKDSGSTQLLYNKDETKAAVNVICEMGYMFNEEKSYCLPCPPGRFSIQGKSCDHCPVGEYQDKYAAHACNVCPSGSTLAYTGAVSKSECNSTQSKRPHRPHASCEYRDLDLRDEFREKSLFNIVGGPNKQMSHYERIELLQRKFRNFYRRMLTAKGPLFKILQSRVRSIENELRSLGGEIPEVGHIQKDAGQSDSTTMSAEKVARYYEMTKDIAEIKKKVTKLMTELETMFRKSQDKAQFNSKQRILTNKAYRIVLKKIRQVKKTLTEVEESNKMSVRTGLLKTIKNGLAAVERGKEDLAEIISAMTKENEPDDKKDNKGNNPKVLEQVMTKQLRGRIVKYEKTTKALKEVDKKMAMTKHMLSHAYFLSKEDRKFLTNVMARLQKMLHFPDSKLTSLTNLKDHEEYNKLLKIEQIIAYVSRRLDVVHFKINRGKYSVHKDSSQMKKVIHYVTEKPTTTTAATTTTTTTTESWENQINDENVEGYIRELIVTDQPNGPERKGSVSGGTLLMFLSAGLMGVILVLVCYLCLQKDRNGECKGCEQQKYTPVIYPSPSRRFTYSKHQANPLENVVTSRHAGEQSPLLHHHQQQQKRSLGGRLTHKSSQPVANRTSKQSVNNKSVHSSIALCHSGSSMSHLTGSYPTAHGQIM